MTVFLPPVIGRYRFALFDERGELVPRTKARKAIPQLIVPERHGIDEQHGYVLTVVPRGYTEPIENAPLLLRDYFEITNSGKYVLRLQIGAVWSTPGMKISDTPKLIFLPPVDAEFNVTLKSGVTNRVGNQ